MGFLSKFRFTKDRFIKPLPLLGLGLLFLASISSCSPAAGPEVELPDMRSTGPVSTVVPEPFQSVLPSLTPTLDVVQAEPVYFTPTPTITIEPEVLPPVQFCSPLENHSLADLQEIITFAYDPPPIGKDTGHHGVDFAYYRRGERLSILGVPIQSFLPGRVAAVNENFVPYGYMIIIETEYNQLPKPLVEYMGIPAAQSLYHLYAHMNELPLPEMGDEVECGQTLGFVGNTPENWSSAPHLHFEARYGPPGGQFSGMQYYDKYSKLDQMEKYALWRMSGEYVLLDPVALLVYGLELTAVGGE